MRTARLHTYTFLAVLSLLLWMSTIAHGTDLNLIEKPSGVLPLGSKYGARIYFHTPQRTAPQTKWKEGDKMSGTRIEVTISAFCGEPSVTTSGQVSDFKVFFENHSSSSPINTPLAGWFGYDQRFKFRFATTITGDGNDLKFRVEATVRENHTQPSYNVSETFTFKAYNKLQLLGTYVNLEGNDSALFETESTAFASQAKSAMSSSHSSVPSNPDAALQQEEADILSALTNSTAFAALTHGDRDEFFDSAKVAFLNFLQGNPSVHSATGPKDAGLIPHFNVVGLWACGVLSGAGPFPVASGFRLLGAHQDVVGFPGAVSALTFTQQQWAYPPNTFGWPVDPTTGQAFMPSLGLHNHSKVYWQKLAEGKTSGQAVDEANKTVQCLTLNGLYAAKIDMMNGNSSMARLKFVFLSSSERQQLQHDPAKIDVWWVELTQFED